MTNEKPDRLTTLLNGFIEKCSAEKVVASLAFHCFPDCLTSEKLPDDDSEPIDGLDRLIFPV